MPLVLLVEKHHCISQKLGNEESIVEWERCPCAKQSEYLPKCTYEERGDLNASLKIINISKKDSTKYTFLNSTGDNDDSTDL